LLPASGKPDSIITGQVESMVELTDTDRGLLRRAIEVARQSRAQGNHPFGALLATETGQVLLEAENTVLTARDVTGHAETNLIRLASTRLDKETLSRCTLYTSAEPCPMCAGAIYWAGLGRVVYGLSQSGLYAMTGAVHDELPLPCREVLARGGHAVKVIGPALEDEARQVHAGFWTQT
jgi:tRNA(Arg) A34 adenosine deaminase TadA